MERAALLFGPVLVTPLTSTEDERFGNRARCLRAGNIVDRGQPHPARVCTGAYMRLGEHYFPPYQLLPYQLSGICSTCPTDRRSEVSPFKALMASTVVLKRRARSQRVSPDWTVYSTVSAPGADGVFSGIPR